MKRLTSRLLAVIILSGCFCKELPPQFTKCRANKPNFQQCLSDSIHSAIQGLYRPLHDYDLPNLSVVNDPEAREEWGNSVDGLHQIFRNYTLYGLSRPLSTKARMNFGTNILEINATFPEVQFDVFYEAHGTVILLPVEIYTELHALFVKPTFRFTFKLEEYGRDVRYYRVLETELVLTAEGDIFDFVNLFNDEILNDAFNKKLTEHAVEILEKFTPQHQGFTPFFQTAFNNLLEKVPKNELFGGFN